MVLQNLHEVPLCLNACNMLPQRNRLHRERPKTSNESFAPRELGARKKLYRNFSSKKDDDKKMYVISPDSIRLLKVPGRDLKKRMLVLNERELNRIKSASLVRSTDEKKANIEKLVDAKEKQLVAVHERRAAFQAIDNKKRLERTVETEALDDAQTLEEMKLEREEETKCLNKLIGEAEGLIILNRQIDEKKTMNDARAAEEKRLDDLVEEERQAAVKRLEERDLKSWTLQKRYGILLQEQMKTRLENEVRHEEMELHEQQVLFQDMKELMEEQPKKAKKEMQKKKEMKEGLDECMDFMMKKMVEDQWLEQVTIRDIENYEKMKQQRVEEYEKRKRSLQKLKEAELLKAEATIKQALLSDAELYEHRNRRYLEARERDLRAKDEQELLEKIKRREELKTMQEEQLAFKQRIVAAEIQRERVRFADIIRSQNESIAKEKGKQDRSRQLRKYFSDLQREQIAAKEKSITEERRAAFQEGADMKLGRQLRLRSLIRLKQEKLDQLRNTCPDVPPRVLNHIDKKLEIVEPPKIKFVKNPMDNIFAR